MIYRKCKQLFLLVAIALLAEGCAKGNPSDSYESLSGVLRFRPALIAAQANTRAAESDNDVLKMASASDIQSSHIVIHTYTGTPGDHLIRYFSDELGYFNSGNYWDIYSGSTRFLPMGGMNLYSYFATDYTKTGNHKDVIYIHPVSPTEYPMLSFTANSNDALHQVDLIAAKVEKITRPDVEIPFHHILSQINFGVKGIDRHSIIVKNIRLNNIVGKSIFDYHSWSWTSDDSGTHRYPYYFPDRNDRESGSGTGQNYATQGSDTDSKNVYLFGDGGKFGAGDASTFLYAQVDPATTNYATKDNSSKALHNSLMLIPQEITKNAAATVTFDYEIKVGNRIIRSGTNSVVHLDQYYDWKPNLRYIYIFDFEDPSEKITFDVLIDEWQNWDGSGGNGLKNGTIQEPTRTTLNNIGDGETIYLLGLLERNLIWDWSDSSKYTFDHFNVLTLDFSGVELRKFSVEVKVPPGFTLTKSENKYVITRNNKLLLEPTANQLNVQKKSDSFVLYGTLADNLMWNWSAIAFASLKQNDTFTLNFKDVIFNSGKSITFTLPANVIAAGDGVSGSNPYKLTTPSLVTITNNRVDTVQKPIRAILDVVSDHTDVAVNGGNVRPLKDTWDWSNYSFRNLDPQESFNLIFSEVVFGGLPIHIMLPAGFRVYINADNKQNPYNVTTNGTVTIKNNKINYPASTQVDALSNGSVITLSGEKLGGDVDLNWSSYAFPNLAPQGVFKLDINNVDFLSVNPLMLNLPSHFVITGGNGISGANPYTLSQKTTIEVKNDKISKPADSQLNLSLPGSVIAINGGRLFTNEMWDWSTVAFSQLGRMGNKLTLRLSDIILAPYTLDIKLSPNVVASGGIVSPRGNDIYRITAGTGDVVITDNRPVDVTRSVTGGNPSFTDIVAGQRVILTGNVSGNQAWSWTQMPTLNPGEWFEIDYSQVTGLSGGAVINLPIAGATYYCTGAVTYTWGVLMYQPTVNNGIVRFTRQYNFPAINDSAPAITNGEYVLPAGTIYGPSTWTWTKWLAKGTYYKINFSNITFVGTLTVTIPNIHVATATGACAINNNTLTITGPCVVTVFSP